MFLLDGIHKSAKWDAETIEKISEVHRQHLDAKAHGAPEVLAENLVEVIKVQHLVALLAVYLVIGLAVSALMNWYNARIALVTR